VDLAIAARKVEHCVAVDAFLCKEVSPVFNEELQASVTDVFGMCSSSQHWSPSVTVRLVVNKLFEKWQNRECLECFKVVFNYQVHDEGQLVLSLDLAAEVLNGERASNRDCCLEILLVDSIVYLADFEL